jgi:hypothetical protein
MVAKERKNKTNKTTPISVNNFVDFIVKMLMGILPQIKLTLQIFFLQDYFY